MTILRFPGPAGPKLSPKALPRDFQGLKYAAEPFKFAGPLWPNGVWDKVSRF